MLRTTALWIVCSALVVHGHAKWYDRVDTQGGVVKGHRAEDGEYIAFLGVPYAAPPVGNNRFKAPLPPPQWDGVYEANHTVMCPQNGRGDEHCLVANIFAPGKLVNGPLPVLVYFHGGSFIIGSGLTYGFEPLTKQDIIVVTVNYRLGALGFLCLGTEEAPGNAGLKDQVASLKWIRNNIANFAGDPNDVTIYGVSAGGSSVEYQILSNMSEGLFVKAIMESGSATSVWAIDADPIATAITVADALGFPKETKNLKELVAFYRQIPAHKLSELNYEYYNNLTDGTFGFVPCVEKELEGTDAFITEAPFDILTKEKYDKVPIMILFATLEGLFLRSTEYYENDYRNRMQANFIDFVPADLVFNASFNKKDAADIIKKFYFGNTTIGDSNIINYLNYFGDYLIMHGLLNSVEVHSKDENPVYLMEFAYKGNMGSYEKFYNDIEAAGHADVVKHAVLINPIQSDDDKLIVDRMTKLIANFVKFGNPTPNRRQVVPYPWPTARPPNFFCLYMDKHLEVSEAYREPYWDRKLFWDQLYNKFRKKVMPVDPKLI